MATLLKDIPVPKLNELPKFALRRVVDIGSEHPDWSVKKCIWRDIRRNQARDGQYGLSGKGGV